MTAPLIVGAGLSGLLAATQFQSSEVFEAAPEGSTGHRALLRFRSSAVGDAVGIEFRKVRVHKGLHIDGTFQSPSIQLANLYSKKVLGRLESRSIWNLDAVDRFIAPDTFLEELIARVGSRIHWEQPMDFRAIRDEPLGHGGSDAPIISTMPMSNLVLQRGLKNHPDFAWSEIHVTRLAIRNSDVFQTIYFPGEETSVYRASITGSTLIVESMSELEPGEIEGVLYAFGLAQLDDISNSREGRAKMASKQQFGKIAPIDDAWRRKFIVEATQRLNVYSLGRFAIWKNILADDVLADIAVIKKLLKGDAYASSLKGA